MAEIMSLDAIEMATAAANNVIFGFTRVRGVRINRRLRQLVNMTNDQLEYWTKVIVAASGQRPQLEEDDILTLDRPDTFPTVSQRLHQLDDDDLDAVERVFREEVHLIWSTPVCLFDHRKKKCFCLFFVKNNNFLKSDTSKRTLLNRTALARCSTCARGTLSLYVLRFVFLNALFNQCCFFPIITARNSDPCTLRNGRRHM